MAQIINNSPTRERDPMVVESGISGWVMTVIILVAVIIAGIYMWRHYHPVAPASGNSTTPSTNVNVTVPNPLPSPSPSSSGSSGGTNSGGTNGGASAGASGGTKY